jgi:hypothetical protein
MKQLEIGVISDGETWQRILEEIRDICRADSRGGPKQVAYDLDIRGHQEGQEGEVLGGASGVVPLDSARNLIRAARAECAELRVAAVTGRTYGLAQQLDRIIDGLDSALALLDAGAGAAPGARPS